MDNTIFGKAGEALACKFLKKKKYKILTKNYRTNFGEIDIIAKKDDTYVFVEVKTRTSLKFGEPKEAVTEFKANTIRRVAENFLKEYGLYDKVLVRFDVIGILGDKKNYEIEHIENAF